MKEMVYSIKRNEEILDSGEYKGYKYVILSLGTHPTAYVENKIGVEDYYDEILDNVIVHGGFTYLGNAYWDKSYNDQTNYIGWDYAHIGDYMDGFIFCFDGKQWTTEEIYKEVKSVIDQLIELQEKKKKTVFYTDNDGESHEAEVESIDGDYCVISFKGQTLRVSKDELDWEE